VRIHGSVGISDRPDLLRLRGFGHYGVLRLRDVTHGNTGDRGSVNELLLGGHVLGERPLDDPDRGRGECRRHVVDGDTVSNRQSGIRVVHADVYGWRWIERRSNRRGDIETMRRLTLLLVGWCAFAATGDKAPP